MLGYITFLKQTTVNFTLQQRNVIVQMNEIHAWSNLLTRVEGDWVIRNSQWTNSYCFSLMVSGLYKKWSTIVRLILSFTTTAESSSPTIERIIRDIELCRVLVQVFCTDDYPLNVSIFKQFSPKKTWIVLSRIFVILIVYCFLCLIWFTYWDLYEITGSI